MTERRRTKAATLDRSRSFQQVVNDQKTGRKVVYLQDGKTFDHLDREIDQETGQVIIEQPETGPEAA